jgi:exodeoxyribonuclease-3
MRVVSYNILDGGVDRDGTSRFELICEVLCALDPDVVALQEANDFERHGQERRFEFERATGMRSLLGLSTSGYHGVLLVKPGFRVMSWHSGSPGTNRALVEARLSTPGGTNLAICGVHLDPFSPEARILGACHAMGGVPGIVMGDFNSPRADDPGVDAAVSRIGRRLLARSGNLGGSIDDRALRAMETAGYVDLFRHAHPTAPGVTMPRLGVRLDYIFATDDLRDRCGDCQVYDADPARRASDHLALFADLDVP